jgi:hypothetical protein
VTVRLLYDTASGPDDLGRRHRARLAGAAVWPEIGSRGNLLHSSTGGGPAQDLEQIWAGRDGDEGGWMVLESTEDRDRACATGSAEEAEAVYERWVREYVARTGVLFESSDVPGCGRDQQYGTGRRPAG